MANTRAGASWDDGDMRPRKPSRVRLVGPVLLVPSSWPPFALPPVTAFIGLVVPPAGWAYLDLGSD